MSADASPGAGGCCCPQLDEAVAQGAPAIPTIHSLLRELCFELDGELGALPPDETYGGSSSGGTGACPHVKACLEHLHVLESVLLIEPPPVAVQYDSQHLQVRHSSTRNPSTAGGLGPTCPR